MSTYTIDVTGKTRTPRSHGAEVSPRSDGAEVSPRSDGAEVSPRSHAVEALNTQNGICATSKNIAAHKLLLQTFIAIPQMLTRTILIVNFFGISLLLA